MDVAALIQEFMAGIQADLERAQATKDGSWERLPKAGEPLAVKAAIDRMFLEYMNQGSSIPWNVVAGYAMIAWLRTAHPEFFTGNATFQAEQSGLAEAIPPELLAAG